jgi:uncharacterized RDD family membrane protein YckC
MEENEMISKSNLASPGHRIGAIAVDLGFYLITFGIGHFIWNLVVMAQGQSPGKQLLKVRVMSETFNKPAMWGHMAVRNFLIPTAMALPFLIPYYVWIFKEFNTNTIGIILLAVCFLIYLTVLIIDFVWLFAPKRKRLIDYWAKTYVVNESANKSS